MQSKWSMVAFREGSRAPAGERWATAFPAGAGLACEMGAHLHVQGFALRAEAPAVENAVALARAIWDHTPYVALGVTLDARPLGSGTYGAVVYIERKGETIRRSADITMAQARIMAHDLDGFWMPYPVIGPSRTLRRGALSPPRKRP